MLEGDGFGRQTIRTVEHDSEHHYVFVKNKGSKGKLWKESYMGTLSAVTISSTPPGKRLSPSCI